MSTRLCESFRASRLSDFPVILGYFPVRGEPDILPLLRSALSEGRTVGLPRCGEGHTMSFLRVTSLSDLSPDAYGIPAPPADAAPVIPDADTLCLLPGLAFDRAGNRLGSGGGYYDRYLPGFPGTAAGVCFSAFLSDAPLPCEPFDRRVSLVLTERGCLPCGDPALNE